MSSTELFDNEKFIEKCKKEIGIIISSKYVRIVESTKRPDFEKKILNEFGKKLIEILEDEISKDQTTLAFKNEDSAFEKIDSKEQNYELIPTIFHTFLEFYFESQRNDTQILKKIDFNWIYDKFKIVNLNSKHFILLNKTIKLIRSELTGGDIDASWFSINEIQKNYELFKNANEYYNDLRELILLSRYLIKRKVKIIKL